MRSAYALAPGDVDGDGDQDLVASGDAWEALYLNDGTGRFTEAVDALPPSTQYAFAFALADVNADGSLDLIAGNWGQSRLYLNDGTGQFFDVTDILLPQVSHRTYALAVGDVDADGDVDLVLGNRGQDSLYLNDGTGRFVDATGQLPVDGSPDAAVALGDVDGDGDFDLVVVNAERCQDGGDCWGIQDRLYLNDGTGHFTDATQRMPVDAYIGGAVALGDVDGDGDLDIVVANYEWTYCYDPEGCYDVEDPDLLYLNDGAGFFTLTSGRIPFDIDGSTAVALVDLDGDDDLDLLIGNDDEGDRLYLNDGAGFFTDATGELPALPGHTKALAVADFDGDADPDVLIGSWVESHLLLNDGDGRLADVTAPLSSSSDRQSITAVQLIELDGDERPDVIVGGPSAATHLYLSRSHGRFVEATDRLPSGADRVVSLVCCDVDGDGDCDLLLGATYDGIGPWYRDPPDRLYLNDGSAHFSATRDRLPAEGPESTLSIVAGDVDRDGDVDLVVGRGSDDALYRNDGKGFFTSSSLPSDDHASTNALALADVDGDGDLDLVLGEGRQDRLYLNDGAGRFTDATSRLPPDSDTSRSLAIADVDGDGDLDLVFGNEGQDRLCLNDGTGRFTDATGQLPQDSDKTLAIALADLDSDGDVDLIAGNAKLPDRLWLNDGTGRFTDAASLMPAGFGTSALAVADVDQDGDLDVVEGDYQLRILSNVAHQLAWQGVPHIGKPLTMDIYGPPWSRFVLSVSGPAIGSQSLAEPRAATHVVGAGFLLSSGHASYRCVIPDDPTLVDRSWLWMVDIDGVRAAEITTFTDL